MALPTAVGTGYVRQVARTADWLKSAVLLQWQWPMTDVLIHLPRQRAGRPRRHLLQPGRLLWLGWG